MRLGRATLSVAFLIGSCVPLAAQTAVSVAADSPSAASPSLCAPPADTVGPVITEVTFGQPSINLEASSRLQTMTATASDASGNGAPSGVARVSAAVRGRHFFAVVKLHLASGTAASGAWTGRFAISKYASPGTYSVESLSISDAAGNAQYYRDYGAVAGAPNALSLHPADNPTFAVTGTPATRPPRKRAGSLSAFSFSPSSVNTTAQVRRVHFLARFTGAQPTRVFVELHSVTKTRRIHFVYLHAALRMSSGRWTGAIGVPRWLGDQALETDLFANFGARYLPSVRDYDALRLHELHFPNRLVVLSGVDKTKPALTSLSFSPTTIDSTTGPEQVTVTATASDTGSGVRYINVDGGIRHGVNGVAAGSYPYAAAGIGYLANDNFRVRLKKTAAGQWVGTTTVKQCVPSGTYRLNVSVADIAGNGRSYSTKQLAAANLTSTIDVTSKHGDTVAPYVYSAATYGATSSLFLNFSEGVANVGTSTVRVYPLSPRATRFTTPAAITAIVCSNGTTTIDCSGSGGLVTSAVLTVPSMTPGKTYEVYTNLDQVTPQLSDGNGNPMQWNYEATQVIDA
jgi:hypothetical protein